MRQIWLILLVGAVLLAGVLGIYQFRTLAHQQSGCIDIPAVPDYVSTGNEYDAIVAINNAHAEEGLPPLHVPFNFYRLGPVQQQFILLNLERKVRHIPPLHMDANLSQVALAYSKQLLTLHFFSHTSPIGGTFGERVDANPTLANHYRFAAENLAGNPVPGAGAIYEYMYNDAAEDCDHRNNILNPALSLVGIGWVRGSVYGSISVQEFLAPAPWNPYIGATPDTQPPHIALHVSLSKGEKKGGGKLRPYEPPSHLHFQALTSDNVGVVRITWFVDHLSSQPTAVGPTWTLDLHHLSPGTHTILAYAVDGEQNYSIAGYLINIRA